MDYIVNCGTCGGNHKTKADYERQHVEGVQAAEAFGDALSGLQDACPEAFGKLVDDGLITRNTKQEGD